MHPLRNLGLATLEWSIAVLDRMADRRGRGSNDAAHLVTGERGERAAYFYLRRRGFVVVARRWNDGPVPGDLDLIAWEGDLLCFIEVKTRGSRNVAASASVDGQKRRILRRLARLYLRQLPEGDTVESRFDIVTVYERPGRKPEIQLIPGAFGWSDPF